MKKYVIMKLKAKNDYNGNPRRLYKVIDTRTGRTQYFDEGYEGDNAIPDDIRNRGIWTDSVAISTRSYNSLKRG